MLTEFQLRSIERRGEWGANETLVEMSAGGWERAAAKKNLYSGMSSGIVSDAALFSS